MRTLKINGKPVEFTIGGAAHPQRPDLTTISVYGSTLSGRMAIVGRHTVSTAMLEHGGSCRGGGNLYEFTRKEA